ncbi:glycosyltransferase family 61 protein [Rhodohalobacter sp. 8-1]|uniref:glycosyltransferase family 61 protein n=1 Tax=Rhodohalobacter sp. 8-1 TaxID=3131972 RepID=UPI0030EC88AC
MLKTLWDKIRNFLIRIARKAVRDRLLSPSWFNYKWVEKETIHEYMDRTEHSKKKYDYESIHEKKKINNPLPRNIERRSELPDDPGWWGYSFWDVPARTSGETFTATLPDCCVVPCINPDDNQFWVTILNQDERSLEMDQITLRPWNLDLLRSKKPLEETEEATWFLERVFRNHSHWITSHLPKLILLKDRDQLENVIFPPPELRTPVIESSFEILNIDPDNYRTFDYTRPLKVKKLTVIETDRFRPELLRSVRDTVCTAQEIPHRRLYISRAKAKRRLLINEDEIWPLLKQLGFEKIFMEDLSFRDQITTMQQAEIVVAPHGAAITNVIFCSPGTHVVEIADLSFPNPNFYALCAAMDHHYWILNAKSVGDMHPLEKDLLIEPRKVQSAVQKILQ